MRITTVIGGLGGGGAERVCVNLANAWSAAGHAVTVTTVTQQSPASTYPLSDDVRRDDVRWPRALRDDEPMEPIAASLRERNVEELACETSLLAALRATIVRTAPDVVVSHMDVTNVRVLAALGGTDVPVVACEHSDPSRNSLGPWQRAREVLYRYASHVVAPHDSIAHWFAQRGLRVRTIGNALEAPPFANSDLRKSSPRKSLVSLGRLSPEKRVELTIRAFRRIEDEFPEWDLDIYGDGPQRDELARQTDARVRLRGFTDDPYAVLARADLYVSASCVEGFGNAVWEALACGVPVVALDCGAPLRTLVRDGVDGRTVRGEERELAAALAELMRDDEARRALASRAREAAQRYPMAAMLRTWDEVLRA